MDIILRPRSMWSQLSLFSSTKFAPTTLSSYSYSSLIPSPVRCNLAVCILVCVLVLFRTALVYLLRFRVVISSTILALSVLFNFSRFFFFFARFSRFLLFLFLEMCVICFVLFLLFFSFFISWMRDIASFVYRSVCCYRRGDPHRCFF